MKQDDTSFHPRLLLSQECLKASFKWQSQITRQKPVWYKKIETPLDYYNPKKAYRKLIKHPASVGMYYVELLLICYNASYSKILVCECNRILIKLQALHSNRNL